MNNDHTKVIDLSAEQQTAVVDTKRAIANSELANNLLGRIEAFEFISKLTTVGSVKLLSELKESKKYIGLTYFDDNGNCRSVGTWDDFCKHKLHSSKSSIDERIINLKHLGEDFLDASQSIGLGVKDLRNLRKLPQEDQTLIIESEAIDAGDKEAVRELIEDLSAKHVKEKEALTVQLSDSKAIANARQNLITKANEQVAETTEELEKLRESQQYQPTDWLKQIQEINFLSTKLAGEAIQAINQLEDLTQRILTEELDPAHSEQALEHLAAVHVYSADQLFVAASRLTMDARNTFEGYVNKARPMYSEKEILLLETQIIARD
ncbi:MAG: hypothetical protein HRU23_19170 [Gammaproteobacteria bacterium]|nr:hypothetical protein [Gammaproteobacteria bacterium]